MGLPSPASGFRRSLPERPSIERSGELITLTGIRHPSLWRSDS